MLFLLLLFFGSSKGQDNLISGPGSTLTENKCKICHELQHIRRAQLSPGEWLDNIRNMKERGLPLTDGETEVIHRYLSTYYNRGQPAPAPSPDTLAAGGDDPVQKILNANACTGCHSLDQRVVGPSFKQVAARYAGTPGAKDRIATRIQGGSVNVWGNIPMPGNAGVSDADAVVLADWILNLK